MFGTKLGYLYAAIAGIKGHLINAAYLIAKYKAYFFGA